MTATEFMVMARRPDGRYFYARELVPTEAVERARFNMAGYLFEKLVGDVLYFRDPEHGGVGPDAEWWGETGVAVIPELEDDDAAA